MSRRSRLRSSVMIFSSSSSSSPLRVYYSFFSFLPFSYFISFSLLFPFLSKKHQPSGSFPPKGNLALAQSVFSTSLCPCACTRTPSRYVQVIKERKEEVEEEDLFLLSPLFQVQKFVRSLFFLKVIRLRCDRTDLIFFFKEKRVKT